MKVRNYSQRTIKTCYNSSLKFLTYCKKEFEVEHIEDMMPIYLKQYISYLQGLGRSEVYINSIIKYLRGFFKYSVKEEYISEKQNIMSKVKWLRQKKVLIRTFNDAEVGNMIKVWNYKNFYNARNKAIIAMLFETGIRNNELCNLRLLGCKGNSYKGIRQGQ